MTYDVAPADEQGNVSVEEMERLVKPQTRAIIVSHASNVCGTVVPIREIGDMCRRRHLIFAVDTAQTAGTLDIDMQECGIDFLAFTGHKGLLGPRGSAGF